MALKRQQRVMEAFSMASMTDVIFLLLVFFMVTSTFVFPTALEVNLPQGVEQTPLKPATRIFISDSCNIYVQTEQADPVQIHQVDLEEYLLAIAAADSTGAMALYADTIVPYGEVVKVLNIAKRNDINMVLATKAAPESAKPDQPAPAAATATN